LTVLFFLPAPISTAHAALAEVFFCIVVAIAVFTSPRWIDAPARSAAPATGSSLARLATATTALVYLQMLIGAAMRHTGAGLAIPDFPLMFGGILPDHWSAAIAVHFAHRVGALVVSAFVIATVVRVWSSDPRRELARPAAVLLALVAIQVALGALTVLTRREPGINSVHVVCGALVLATSLVITLRARREAFGAGSVRLKPDTTIPAGPRRSPLGSVRLQPDQTLDAIGLQPDRIAQDRV
jgi:cytochrome c oxidase assembly protein subunit 15